MTYHIHIMNHIFPCFPTIFPSFSHHFPHLLTGCSAAPWSAAAPAAAERAALDAWPSSGGAEAPGDRCADVLYAMVTWTINIYATCK